MGLVLRLRTSAQPTPSEHRVELLLDGVTLASAYVGPLLRAASWSVLRLDLHPVRGVSVWLREVPLLSAVALPSSWRPADHWRLGLGARTAGDHGAEHRLRSLRLRSALLAASTSARVAVSLNGGADFSPLEQGPTLAYAAIPALKRLLPLTGPSLGGTALTLRGPALCAPVPWHLTLRGQPVELSSTRCPPPPPPPATPAAAPLAPLAAPYPARPPGLPPLVPEGDVSLRVPAAAVAPFPPPPPPPPRPCEEWCDGAGISWAYACAGGRDGAWADRCAGCAPCAPPPPPPPSFTLSSSVVYVVDADMAHFNVSLNGQQWHAAGEIGLAIYEPPSWDHIAPTAGPLAGGTLQP